MPALAFFLWFIHQSIIYLLIFPYASYRLTTSFVSSLKSQTMRSNYAQRWNWQIFWVANITRCGSPQKVFLGNRFAWNLLQLIAAETHTQCLIIDKILNHRNKAWVNNTKQLHFLKLPLYWLILNWQLILAFTKS